MTIKSKRAASGLSEEHFKSVFDDAPVGMCLLDKSGNLIRVNHAFSNLLGYADHQILRKNFRGLTHPEDLEMTNVHLRRLLKGEGESVNLEKRYVHKDGHVVWTAVTSSMLRSANPLYVISHVQDITERKQAQVSLAASEMRFRRLFEAARDGILILDAGTGEITDANPFLEEILGYSRQHFLQRKLWDIGLFQDVEHCKRTFERLQQDKYVRYENLPLRRRSGEHVEVEFVSNVYEVEGHKVIQCNIRDISERKRAAEALRESEERFRVTFEQAAVGIAHVAPNGQLLRVNQRYCDIVGYSPEELLERRFQDITYSDDLPAYTAYVDLILAGSRESHSIEKRYVRKDGVLIWVNLSNALLNHPSGKPKYLISVVQDITERKHLEEQFLQAQKMEAVGRLAGGIAHDFNNLLTVITGYCDLLWNRLGNGGSVYKEINQIKLAAERAGTLTTHLLAFSRRQVVQLEVIDLNIVVKDVEQLLFRLIGEDIRLTTTLAAELGLIKTDRGQLTQIIMNLAVNARDAMPEGGALTIETRKKYLSDEYTLSRAGVQPGAYVMLRVSDTGCGMDAETQSQIFEPFFTTKEQGRGTGLGLSTVYGIVQQNEGHIVVDSAPGSGSTFEIYFPKFQGAVKTIAEPSIPASRTGGTETVLLVEDDNQVRSLTSEILKGEGYTVLEADSGLEALLLSQRHAGPIHLMLTDMVMPGMNGYLLAEQLMSSRSAMVVLYMSGYPWDAAGRDGSIGPDTTLIMKPFTREQLLGKVREVLDAAEERTNGGVHSASSSY